MPYFRGIEISIHASLEAKQVTEYPHPDGSSVRLMRTSALPAVCDATAVAGRASQPNSPPVTEDVDPTRLKKLNPRISVYIPSLPGEQFWLRYLVSQSPPPSRCIFFKMTMNGRHISSWGINTNTRSTGVVVRALYQPETKWGDACGHNEAGYPGIETRYFHFMPGLDKKSAAEDGGIIEVQVFRCKGRKRIALELDVYKNQERYGITSMKYLQQLNLIPQLGFDTSPASQSSIDVRRERFTKEPGSRSTSPITRRFTFDATTLESQVFDNTLAIAELDEMAHAETKEEYFLKSPPEISPSSLRAMVSKASSKAPSTAPSDEIQQRPLPEIPNNSQARPTSASSLRSNCPSLTPSLRLYVESEDFENEDIRLSTAQPMMISSESMQALELVNTGAEEGGSFSDYASSPSSTEASHSLLPSPTGYIPTTGSVLERHLTQFDSPLAKSSPLQTQKMSSSKTNGPLDSDQTEPRTGVLNLTEAEWLRHTPSPLQLKDKSVERMWNSCPESGNEEFTGALDGDSQRHNPNIQSPAESIDQAPMGNWI
ncbi:hypothetical protein NUW58_g6877 [Xylaria curta]|uniref:Uncharacterized protein n=1 Tax=Xylaria curta TaxID=42375 RepID=A0ACC1NQL9_9PEZI|nr:hypothetical protein NUW58_g6877 [Xylaria curta]